MAWIPDIVIDEAYWETKPLVLGVPDLAQITRKGEPTIWRWLKEGKIPGHHIAGSWIVYREVFHHQINEPDANYPLPIDLLAKYPEELTVQELSELLGKTKQTIWRWLGNDRLPGVGSRYQGTWLVYKHELIKLLKETSNQATPLNDSSDS